MTKERAGETRRLAAPRLSGPFRFSLEQVPKKPTAFVGTCLFDENLLQPFDLARFLIDQMIPFDRKAR